MKGFAFLSALLFMVTIVANNALNAQINDKQSGKLPEFTHSQKQEWINSDPLSLNDLKGKVILIDMWTFDCWNCYRSFPWLNTLEEKYQDKGLQVIGVHTPEFDHEKI